MFGIQTNQEHIGQNFFISRFKGNFFKLRPQGSYRQGGVKFKDFSRTSKRLSYCFQGLKPYEKY